MSDCEQIYAIPRWGEGYFHVNAAGHLCARPDPDSGAEVDLADLAVRLRDEGLSLPVLVRFNDILRHRVRSLHRAFEAARENAGYEGRYTPVYPIKVNQQRSVVEQILHGGNTGLEAGSKPELMAVLAMSAPGALTICNGYKDREYIRLALIGRVLGLRLFIVVEKPSELPLILEEAQRLGVEPLLGVRTRLAAEASGKWQSSGGEKAKFGLQPGQLLELVETLRKAGKLHWLQLLHAHMGSQIPNLHDIRRGLRELVRYYAELHRLGVALRVVDVGGGLGVDYEGTATRDFCSINYNLDAYAEAVVGALRAVCDEQGLPHPDIVTESGRAMTAHHAVLITNVSDREGDQPPEQSVTADGPDDPLLRAMAANLARGDQQPPLELFETARELLGEVREAFESGRLDLAARARGEALFAATCRVLPPRLELAPPT
jgi:arginine decarboxylase